eukprot:234747_1
MIPMNTQNHTQLPKITSNYPTINNTNNSNLMNGIPNTSSNIAEGNKASSTFQQNMQPFFNPIPTTNTSFPYPNNTNQINTIKPTNTPTVQTPFSNSFPAFQQNTFNNLNTTINSIPQNYQFLPIWKWQNSNNGQIYLCDPAVTQALDNSEVGELLINPQNQYQYKKLSDTSAVRIYCSKLNDGTIKRETWNCKLQIFESNQPRHKLSESNFLKLYQDFKENQMDNMTVYAMKMSLPSVIIKRKLNAKLMQLQEEKLDDTSDCLEQRIAVWLWSLEGGQDTANLYKILNEALYCDNYDDLERFMPLIHGLNQYLVKENKHKLTTYRGSQMSEQHFENIKRLKGSIIRCPAIAASSESVDKAREFKSNYMIQFDIPEGIWNASSVSEHSQFKDEKEVLFPPYSSFLIKTIENKFITPIQTETW